MLIGPEVRCTLLGKSSGILCPKISEIRQKFDRCPKTSSGILRPKMSSGILRPKMSSGILRPKIPFYMFFFTYRYSIVNVIVIETHPLEHFPNSILRLKAQGSWLNSNIRQRFDLRAYYARRCLWAYYARRCLRAYYARR